MSSDIAISVKNVGKCYEMYEKPHHRLFQTLFHGRKQFYKEFWALQDISFEVKKSECLGIIGRNGCGKSTLLQIIAGTLQATTGSVEVNGRVAALLELGSGFNPEFTGRENVFMNGTVLGLTHKEIDEKFDSIAAFADIGEFIEQPVKIYSSGMVMRLAFAINTHVNADILIVDEALAVGDAAFQRKCFSWLKKFRMQGKTILFVSHDFNSVLQNCNLAMVLSKGENISTTSPKDAVEIYKKILTGTFHSYEENELAKQDTPKTNWKNNYQKNPDFSKYGNNSVEIIDYAILNEEEKYSQTIYNDEWVNLKMKIRFMKSISNPIFAWSVKSLQGLELCGSNTLCTDSKTGDYNSGDIVDISFRQKISLAPGAYTLSLGCTKHDDIGNLEVFDRLYDILIFRVITTRQSTAMFETFSEISVKKVFQE